MDKLIEKCYYFAKWTIPNGDFKTFFKSDYLEDEEYLELMVAGQDVNGYIYNIYWKSIDDENLKGEVKYINWKSSFALASTNWEFDNGNSADEDEEDIDLDKYDYIEVEVPHQRLPKPKNKNLDSVKEQDETGYDSDTDKSSSSDEDPIKKVMSSYGEKPKGKVEKLDDDGNRTFIYEYTNDDYTKEQNE